MLRGPGRTPICACRCDVGAHVEHVGDEVREPVCSPRRVLGEGRWEVLDAECGKIPTAVVGTRASPHAPLASPDAGGMRARPRTPAGMRVVEMDAWVGPRIPVGSFDRP